MQWPPDTLRGPGEGRFRPKVSSAPDNDRPARSGGFAVHASKVWCVCLGFDSRQSRRALRAFSADDRASLAVAFSALTPTDTFRGGQRARADAPANRCPQSISSGVIPSGASPIVVSRFSESSRIGPRRQSATQEGASEKRAKSLRVASLWPGRDSFAGRWGAALLHPDRRRIAVLHRRYVERTARERTACADSCATGSYRSRSGTSAKPSRAVVPRR